VHAADEAAFHWLETTATITLPTWNISYTCFSTTLLLL